MQHPFSQKVDNIGFCKKAYRSIFHTFFHLFKNNVSFFSPLYNTFCQNGRLYDTFGRKIYEKSLDKKQ